MCTVHLWKVFFKRIKEVLGKKFADKQCVFPEFFFLSFYYSRLPSISHSKDFFLVIMSPHISFILFFFVQGSQCNFWWILLIWTYSIHLNIYVADSVGTDVDDDTILYFDSPSPAIHNSAIHTYVYACILYTMYRYIWCIFLYFNFIVSKFHKKIRLILKIDFHFH